MIGASRGVVFAITSVLAVAVPALLGATDYGRWVVFRSIIGMLTGPAALGLVSVMSVHYVSRVIEGRRLEAMRLFKAAAILRLGLAVVVVAIGGLMVWATPAFSDKTWFALWLAAALFLRLAGNTLLLLLFGERNYKRLAIARVLQQCTVPAAIIPAYLAGGFALIPVAAALGEGLNALIFFGLVRRYLSWPSGWPHRDDWKVLARFAGAVSFSSAGQRVFINAVPFLMGLAGVAVTQIGYVGLATRFMMLISGTLQQTSRAMMPSTRVIMKTKGVKKVVAWHSFTCRAGLLLCLAATGVFLLAGSTVVPSVWGEEYRGAIPIMAIVLAAGALRWVGFNHSQMLVVVDRAGYAARSVFWMLAAFFTAFLFLVPGHAGIGAAIAILAGTCAFMVSAMIYVQLAVHSHLGLERTWGPIAVTASAVLLTPHLHSSTSRIIAAGFWSIGFALSAFISRSLGMDEIRQLLNNVRASGRSNRRSAASG
jgi:O-antigen/teichoic acid export membrane protein